MESIKLGSIIFNNKTYNVFSTKYADGNTAFILSDRDKLSDFLPDDIVISLNFPGELADNEICIKDSDIYVGTYNALIDANIIKKTEFKIHSGFLEFPIGIIVKNKGN